MRNSHFTVNAHKCVVYHREHHLTLLDLKEIVYLAMCILQYIHIGTLFIVVHTAWPCQYFKKCFQLYGVQYTINTYLKKIFMCFMMLII
jgi:hypothetical protein